MTSANRSIWKELGHRIMPPPSAQEAALSVNNETLMQRTAIAGTVRVVAQIVGFTLSVIGTMALARLLRPSDFGLFAMAGTLTAFVGSFRDFGLPMAVVYEDQVAHDDINALFWLNLRLNIGLVGFMVLMAPVLAWFYKEPVLVWILLVCTIGVLVTNLSSQHDSLLTRQMRFGQLSVIDLLSAGAGLIVALGLALLGGGVWALVAQYIVYLTLRTLGIWFVCRWRPTRPSGRETVENFVRYGRDVTLFRVVAHIGRNLDRVVVSFFNGAAAVGLYQSAYHWSTLPVQQIYAPLLNVAVSSLSKVRTDRERYRKTAHGVLLPVFALSMPVLAFLTVEAERSILFLLGQQWVDAVPLFRVLCIGSLVGSMSMVTKWLYLSTGETRRQLRWGLIYTPAMVVAVLVGALWGPLGVAWGFSLGTILLTPISLRLCLAVTPLTEWDFFSIVWRPLTASAVAAGVSLLWTASPDIELLPGLLRSGIGFTLTYAVVWYLLPGGRRDVVRGWQIMRALLPKKRRRFMC